MWPYPWNLRDVLVPFIPGQTSLGVTAWLAPIFLLRFSRTMHPLVALPTLMGAILLGYAIAFRNGFVPFAGPSYYVALVGIALAYGAIFAIDRLLWRRYSGILSTLVFPLASTTVGYLATLGNPLGTAGSEAYGQTEQGLLQIVSLTGVWGIVFLLAWFASVVNAWWEQHFSVRNTAVPLVAFSATVLAIVALGEVRLAIAAPPSATVRVALLAPNRLLNEQSRIGRIRTAEERDAARAVVTPLVHDLFARSEQAAQAGARIIVWSEVAAKILKEDEAGFIARAQHVALSQDVYLQVGLSTFQDVNGDLQTENRAILFTPDGVQAWDYHKSKPTPGDAEVPGPGLMPTFDSAYGRLATVICQDDLFPELVSQAGRAGVDILFMPSSDWYTIAVWHAEVAKFRSIENGVSIVRPTRQGHSLVTDPKGRTIASKSDYFVGDDQTLIAALPTEGITTLYPKTGDWLAHLSIIALVFVAVLALFGSPRVRQWTRGMMLRLK